MHYRRVLLVSIAVSAAWADSGVDTSKAQVFGSGSTTLAPLFEVWCKAFNTENPGANLTYDSSALVHNLLDEHGARVRQLSLDRATLARIFSFDLLWWDDPALVALNPRVRLPHRRINVVVRGDSSGSSAIMTKSLVSFGWLDTPGCRRAGSGCEATTHLYRATPGEVGPGGRPLYHYDTAAGSSGLTRHVDSTLWSIGYVGVATALQYEVPFAVMYNRKGRPTVANRDFTLLSGASATLDLERFSGDAHDQEGYPIVGYAYVMLWHRPEPARQFDTVEPEYKGYTKDYKQAVDSGVAPNGRNWGWGAGHQLHLPGKTCEEYNYLYQFFYWMMHSVEARVVVAETGLVTVPLGVANRALARLMEAECGDAHWTSVRLVRFGVRNDLAELLMNEVGHVYNTPREDEEGSAGGHEEEEGHEEEGHGAEGSQEEEGHEEGGNETDHQEEEDHESEGSGEEEGHEEGGSEEEGHGSEAEEEGHEDDGHGGSGEAGGHDDAGGGNAGGHGHGDEQAGGEDHEPTVLSSKLIRGELSEAVLLMLPTDLYNSSANAKPDAAVPLSGYIPVPVATSAIVLVYNSGVQGLLLPLELPMSTIRGILTGTITKWRHPTILENNRYLPVPDLQISICAHRTSLREVLMQFQLDALAPTVRVVQQAHNGALIETPAQVAAEVQHTPGLLGVVPLMTALSWDLSQVYPIVMQGLGGLRPSFESVEETARDAKWVEDLSRQEHGDNVHHLHYPFWHVLWLYVREESTATGEEEETLRAAFAAARWLAGAVSSSRQEVSAEAALRSVQYMSLGTCCGLQERILKLFRRLRINGQVVFPEHTDESEVLPLWLILLLSGLGVVLIGVVVFLFVKNLRDTKNIRNLRNTNAIAERSAEAIAEMRLEEMDYLWEIDKPNRIQRAFMGIVSSLKEYRKYLPQSCLPTAEDDDEVETGSNTSGAGPQETGEQRQSSVASVRSSVGSRRTVRVQPGGAHRAEPRHQQVTLLCANRRGFLSASELHKPSALVEWLARSMSAFVEAVGKGVVDYVGGDHCFASFGAARPCPNRRVAATLCAWNYAKVVNSRSEAALTGSGGSRPSASLKAELCITTTVVSGGAICGDFGTNALLRFMTVGGIYSMLQATERLASQWGSKILIDGPTYTAAAGTFICRLISAVTYAKRGSQNPVLLWDALAPTERSNAEWMYVLDQGCTWKEYNAAMELWLRNGATEEATAAATSVAQAEDADVAAAGADLLRIVQEASDSGNTRPIQYKVVELTVQGVSSAWN